MAAQGENHSLNTAWLNKNYVDMFLITTKEVVIKR